MEATTIKYSTFLWWRPIQFEGTSMLPNVLLMCKMLVLLVLAHHFFAELQDPFIPFIPALDEFNAYPNVFKVGLRIAFVMSVASLFFNIYVRTSAIIIGSIIILQILASKSSFANHKFVCGCALLLAGLSDNKQPPYLIFIQMALIYFGASLNKMFDPHWWSGDFMHTWLGEARENPFYLYVKEWFPFLWFAKLLSFLAISTEFSIAILLLFKKYRNFAVWFIVIFHTILFTLTSFRFGHFIESLGIVLLAFLAWPKSNMIVSYKKNCLNTFRRILSFLDFDKKIVWKEQDLENNAFLKLKTKEKTLENDVAIKDLIIYTPAFYIILVISDMVLYVVLYNHRTELFVLNVIALWIIIIYFLPIKWSKYFYKNTTYK